MITLVDTFNGVTLSRHRTLDAAIRAQRRHLASVRRHNGPNSYLTYEFRDDSGPIDPDTLMEARLREESE